MVVNKINSGNLSFFFKNWNINMLIQSEVINTILKEQINARLFDYLIKLKD